MEIQSLYMIITQLDEMTQSIHNTPVYKCI